MSKREEPVVIVGAGVAGVQAAAALRKAGYAGRLVLIGAEPHPPYDRPPLSKQVLRDGAAEAKLALRPDSFYAEQEIELQLGEQVVDIDPDTRRMRLHNGSDIEFAELILATGSEPRTFPLLPPGTHNVHYLRSLDDSRALRARLRAGARLAIIGGGIIGLEVAAAASDAGVRVRVIEAAPRVLGRACCPLISEFLAARHRAHGVEIDCHATVGAAAHRDGIWHLTLHDGRVVEADAVLVAVGVRPCLSLARGAGLAVSEQGIETDAFGRTSAPHVWAAGEVAYHLNVLTGARERQENWLHAAAHGAHVGRAIVDPGTGYAELCGYWTDQYDVSIQTAGIPAGDEDILKGDPAACNFIVYHLREGIIVGATSVNAMRELRRAKALIRARQGLDALAPAAATAL